MDTPDVSRPEVRARLDCDYLVIVPTVGDGDVLIPTMTRLLRHCDGVRAHVVVVMNPDDWARAAPVAAQLEAAARPDGVTVEIVRMPGLAGFSAAVNAGIRAAARHGFPAVTVVINDDAHVTAGWLPGLRAALDTATVRLQGDPQDADRDVAGYGRIGIVGPASDNVSGSQRVELPRGALDKGLDAFAYQYRQANTGNVMSADFVSGFCVAVRYEALPDLLVEDRDGGGLFDAATYPIGGYEDNDLCARADRAGWRAAIAGDVFVHHDGHRTFDRLFPGQARGLANRIAYYRKWAPQTVAGTRRIVAVYRVRLETAHDLLLWRNSVAKVGTLVDGIAVLLTGNPLEICQSPDWESMRGALSIADSRLLESCSGANPTDTAIAARMWVERMALAGIEATKTPRQVPEIAVSVWDGAANERDERNAAIALGETMRPDWLLAVDHDEVPEDRVTREHVERLTRHPDPLVHAWDFGWLNHWDSARLVRQDAPWADGAYRTGMRGFRLWRANPAAPRRILAGTATGLHCGNCPDFDLMSKRVSSLRFRHFGYVRAYDRQRKHARYTRLDPDPDARLTGGAGYAHILHEEGMRLSAYASHDGIGLHVLLHPGESAVDVGRWLDALHGIVDCVVLVWTADWDQDRPAMFPAGPELSDPAPSSGPGADLWALSQLFGAFWTFHPLDDHMAGARNAGIVTLGSVFRARFGLGWALFVDPDEWLDDEFADCVALRRMAECSDSYGWMFRVQNYHLNEAPTRSESVRMSRLDDDATMLMNARVHESFTHAVDKLHAAGVAAQFRYAPFVLHHRGLALSPDRLKIKITRYGRLLAEEVVEDPRNADAWVALGCHYLANNRHGDAQRCFECGLLARPTAYGASKELALHHLRTARGLMAHVVENTVSAVSYHRVARTMLDWLREWAPNPPTLWVVPDPASCPEFPEPAAAALTAADVPR